MVPADVDHGRSRDRAVAVNRALADVSLTSRRASTIKALSGGMRRRLGIAHALVHDPDVLLLDEPTVGLAPRQRIEVRQIVRTLAGRDLEQTLAALMEEEK